MDIENGKNIWRDAIMTLTNIKIAFELSPLVILLVGSLGLYLRIKIHDNLGF